MNRLYSNLIKRSLTSPLHIVDIGASEGIQLHWRELDDQVRAILFEPDKASYDKLKESSPKNYLILNSALYERACELQFNICAKQKVSSVFLPNFKVLNEFPDAERFKILRQVKLNADTLDNQLSINNIDDVDFIKIDTQGCELPILKGSPKALERAICLHLEVCFLDIYENQPLFSEVDNFVKKFDFQLFNLRKAFWQKKNVPNFLKTNVKGYLVFGDAVYFKKIDKILEMAKQMEGKLVKAIIIFLVYGYEDLACELYDLSLSKKLLRNDNAKAVNRLLKGFLTKKRLKVFVINKLSYLLERLW